MLYTVIWTEDEHESQVVIVRSAEGVYKVQWRMSMEESNGQDTLDIRMARARFVTRVFNVMALSQVKSDTVRRSTNATFNPLVVIEHLL